MPEFCIGVPILRYNEQFKTVFATIINAIQGFDCEVIIGIQELASVPKKGAEYLFSTPKVNVIDSSLANTLSENLNNIINSSNSPYFIRMDDDDYMHPRRISSLESTINNYPSFSIIGQSYKVFSKGTRASRSINPSHYSDENKKKLLFTVPFAHPAITLNLNNLIKPKYDSKMKYAQDYMLYIDNIMSGDYIGTNDVSLYYRAPNKDKLGYLEKRQKQLQCHEHAMMKLWGEILKIDVKRDEIHQLRCLHVTNEFCKCMQISEDRKHYLANISNKALTEIRKAAKIK